MISDLLFLLDIVFRRRRLRQQEWEGTVAGRVGGDIWMLTSSGKVRGVTAALSKPFRKTLKMGDHLAKHRGVLKPEVTPQDWDDLNEDTRQKVLEISKDIVEREKSSQKARSTRAIALVAICHPVILGFYMLKTYYQTHRLVFVYVFLAAIILPLIIYVWLIVWIRRQ